AVAEPGQRVVVVGGGDGDDPRDRIRGGEMVEIAVQILAVVARGGDEGAAGGDEVGDRLALGREAFGSGVEVGGEGAIAVVAGDDIDAHAAQRRQVIVGADDRGEAEGAELVGDLHREDGDVPGDADDPKGVVTHGPDHAGDGRAV